MDKKKILVIDDETSISDSLSLMLGARGFDVITASNGISALSEATTNHLNLIILDLIMPGIDGYEICRRLKNNKEAKRVPVIILSGKFDRDSISKAQQAGADDYIVKPFTLPTLMNKINCLISK
jgi:two-component system, OmpR family, alkaline phosphatase synthesis response regulator PhoP